MKTTKLIAAIGLSILATLMISSSTFAGGKGLPSTGSNLVRYEVNVHLSGEQFPSNTYWIEVTDLNGRLVVPAQTFIPGVSMYVFYENGRGNAIRIARFVLSPNLDRLAGGNLLWARPDVKAVLFISGETYSFNLFPTNERPKD